MALVAADLLLRARGGHPREGGRKERERESRKCVCDCEKDLNRKIMLCIAVWQREVEREKERIKNGQYIECGLGCSRPSSGRPRERHD